MRNFRGEPTIFYGNGTDFLICLAIVLIGFAYLEYRSTGWNGVKNVVTFYLGCSICLAVVCGGIGALCVLFDKVFG